MALSWLRRKQKQVLIPLSVLVIIAFVFLFGAGGRGGGGGGGGGIVAEVAGREIARAEYVEYLRILRALGYRTGDRYPFYLLARAEAARQAGLRIGTEELRDGIRAVVKRVFRPGPGELTDSEYRDALAELAISPSAFEEFMEVMFLSETMPQIVAATALVTEDEYYLAYCRERERLTIRQRDFVVASYVKDVEKPTDEEVREYFDVHGELDPELETALATESEVAIEYGFVEKKLAGRIARRLRDNGDLTRPEGQMAGPLSSAAGGLARAAARALREKEIRDRYERDKDRRYKLPDEPKEPEKKEGKEVKEGEEAKEVEEAEAGEAKEGEAAEGEKKVPAEPRYRPLDDVRDEIAKRIDSPLEGRAARSAAERVLEVAGERSRFRTFEADSLTAGLGLAVLPAALGSSGVWDRADFMGACEEAGAIYGVTRLLKEKELKDIKPLGRVSAISGSAIRYAKTGTGDELKRPASATGGYAVWRVADYRAPRTLTYDEARDAARRRIVHARAERKAREAAADFVAELVEGTADLSTMREKHPYPATHSRVRPFATLGVGEVPEEPVAFEKDGDTPVPEGLGRSDEELAVMKTARYRVGIVVDRDTPTREGFGKESRKERGWRSGHTARMLPLVRHTFMLEHWRDEALDKVEARYYRETRR